MPFLYFSDDSKLKDSKGSLRQSVSLPRVEFGVKRNILLDSAQKRIDPGDLSDMSELNGLPFQQFLSPLFVLVKQLTVLHPRLGFGQTALFPHIFLGSASEFGDIDSGDP